MVNNYGYDKTNSKSIESYTKKLIGKTFRDVIDEEDAVKERVEEYNYQEELNEKNKGNLGHIIEENYFGYKKIMTQDQIFMKQELN